MDLNKPWIIREPLNGNNEGKRAILIIALSSIGFDIYEKTWEQYHSDFFPYIKFDGEDIASRNECRPKKEINQQVVSYEEVINEIAKGVKFNLKQ